MRKLLLLFNLSIITCFHVSSQTKQICSLDNYKYFKNLNISNIDDNESFKDSKEASKFIEQLLKLLDLEIPMNFKVHECTKADCRNNAYAAMDIEGNRHIIYDNKWFKSLESGNQKVESLTILAHEIGHHLAAHTLSLNYYNHEDAVKYCSPTSNNYDKLLCEKQYQNEYLQYLRKSRKQELEADRFSGFIMNMYEVELADILAVFRKFSKEEDDAKSTHPSLKKRLRAIEKGYKLAEEKKKDPNLKIDIQKIKGTLLDFKIKNKTILERNKILSKIKTHIAYNPISYIIQNSNLQFSQINTGGVSQKTKEKFIKYLGYDSKSVIIDTKNEYFMPITTYIGLAHNTQIKYNPLSAIHVKDGIFKILIFGEKESPIIVYSSPFDKDLIGYKEIEVIFVEIFSNGIQRVMDKYSEE